MSFWVLLQVLVNLLLLASTLFLWMKLNRPQKDDPRMSRGLQLLQSKISVLEDLSDRTETQVQQLLSLIEQKTKEIQTHIASADKQIAKIETSRERSLEVAKIFQDKIPHQEIIERQNSIKYIKAALLAHQGASIDEIMQSVDLARGEIEFIAKVNRDALQFSVDDLPEWARGDLDFSVDEAPVVASPVSTLEPTNLKPATQSEALEQLGDQFRKALNVQVNSLAQTTVHSIPQPSIQSTTQTKSFSPVRVREAGVKKVVFPKIDMAKNLG